MERSIFAALVGGLLGISTLSGLAFIWGPFEPHQPPPPAGRSEGEWRLLEPVTYENISVFPVVSSNSQDTSPFLTLEEGLSTGEVLVREQGSEGLVRGRDGRPVYVPQNNTGASVSQLVLINRSRRPLLLLAGELVSGGKQDRVIGKDRIIPAGAPPLPLSVFCVEHGRWTGVSQFTAAKTIVHPSVREKAAVDQEQAYVWDAVRSGTTSKAAPAAPAARMSMHDIQGAIDTNGHTEAYEKIYQSRAVGVSIDDFVEEVRVRFARATSGLKDERVVGVVVAYGGEVAWATSSPPAISSIIIGTNSCAVTPSRPSPVPPTAPSLRATTPVLFSVASTAAKPRKPSLASIAGAKSTKAGSPRSSSTPSSPNT